MLEDTNHTLTGSKKLNVARCPIENLNEVNGCRGCTEIRVPISGGGADPVMYPLYLQNGKLPHLPK